MEHDMDLSNLFKAITSSDTAAWVQAFGSIAAIYCAYRVGATQARAALLAVSEAARLQDERKAKGHIAVVEAATAYAAEIKKAVDAGDPFALINIYHTSVTQGYAKALRAIPAHEVGDADGVKSLLSMSNQFLLLEASLEIYVAGPERHAGFKEALETYERPEYRDPHKRNELVRRGSDILASNVVKHLNLISGDSERIIGALSKAA